jgi:hypothetical protein
MAVSQSRPGRLAGILQRLKIRRLRSRIATGVDYAISSTVSLLGCLFAAEVAVGRRITQRDPEPALHREADAAHQETPLLPALAEQPDSSSVYAARCVEIFGRAAGSCPVTGGRAPARHGRKRLTGRARCIHFPRCKYRCAASRCSKVSVQDWLKLHQPPSSRSRRHRDS